MSNWPATFLDHWRSFAHVALPQTCVLCGAAAGASRFCAPCAPTLPRLPDPRCRWCASALTSGEICGACLEHPPAYDAVSAAFAYDFPVDALIHAYKYGHDLTLAPVLAGALVKAVRDDVDLIVAMPLSHARLRERGFNQAHEIARVVAHRLGLPLLTRACRRVADTPPQAALPWKERARNVRNAFVCDADLTGRRVAVVDDVMTTGATMHELARNLKRAGAIHVSCWVVARTLKHVPL